MAVAGLADSAYLTAVHYSSAPLACAQTAVVNCDLVTRSSFGLVPGTAVPVSAAGLLWFGISLGLSLRDRPPGAVRDRLQLAWSLAGVAVVLYLVWAELRLAHLCEWCTLAHVLVATTAMVAVGRLSTRSPSAPPAPGEGARPA